MPMAHNESLNRWKQSTPKTNNICRSNPFFLLFLLKGRTLQPWFEFLLSMSVSTTVPFFKALRRITSRNPFVKIHQDRLLLAMKHPCARFSSPLLFWTPPVLKPPFGPFRRSASLTHPSMEPGKKNGGKHNLPEVSGRCFFLAASLKVAICQKLRLLEVLRDLGILGRIFLRRTRFQAQNGSGQNIAKGVPFCDNVFLKMVSGDAVSTIFLQPTAQSDFLSAVSTS